MKKYKTKEWTVYVLMFVSGMVAQALFIAPENIHHPTIVQSNGLSCHVCFTPGQACLPLIIDEINKAQKTVHVQSYSFTSKPLAEALLRAHQKGISIVLIADKSQQHARHSKIHSLKQAGISVYIDHKPSIAHNKIILIDGITTIGGSYNYSNAAEHKNAENVTIIKSKELASLYEENFNKRLALSLPLS